MPKKIEAKNEDPRLLIRNNNTENSQSYNSQVDTKTRKQKYFKIFGKIALIVLTVFILTFVIAYFVIANSFTKIGLNITPIDAVNIATTQISALEDSKTEKLLPPQLLKDTTETVTNFLLVGIDTRPNSTEGLLNTDSIILISYNHRTQELTLLSIPRDTIVKSPESDRYFKINSFYMLGEQISQGYGLEHLSKVVKEYTGQEINYYAMFNFNSFTQIIDALGGIEVNVENSFTDYNYPDAPDNYLHFDAGLQTMDGTRALMFVRSRHSNDNNEGSDFGRARRQQKVVEALKAKIISTDLLLNPQRTFEILSSIGNNLKLSGYSANDINAAIYLLKNNQISKINSVVLDPNVKEGTLLTEDRWTELGYSITPITSIGDYSPIHEFVFSTLFATNTSKLNPSISVYDCGGGYEKTFNISQGLRNKMGIFNVQLKGNCTSEYNGNNLIYHGDRDLTIAKSEIEKYLKIKIINNSTDTWTYTDNSEIILLVGEN